MTKLAHRVILAWGWRRWLLAFAAGALGALAMPPFGIVPALALSLVVAVWLIDGAATRTRFGTLASAAAAGWFWGFGYFVAGLWWLGSAFLVEADQFAWALPLGVLGLPALLAFFCAFGFALSRLLWSPSSWRILALGFGLGLSEWLRGHLFTGFPWNTLGMAFGQNLLTMQGAAIAGLYGLTLLAILVLAAPATIGTGRTTVARFAPSLLGLGALASLVLYGAVRVPSEPMSLVPGVKLRIMQPNLPQDAKFNPSNRDAIMAHYLRLSDRATGPRTSGVADATHLIWPESAFPFLLHRDARALAQIAALLPAGVTLVTGAARAEDGLMGEDGPRYYNAIQVVAHDGTITATYDKTHLVPFGEYFPAVLDAILRNSGLREFVHIPGGFTAGDRRAPLAIPGLPLVAASVCYEAIFPGALVQNVRPGLILNVTNDAWFGDSPGPRQHFAQARLRAVEEGLPLVRAANTGISAVVDPFGRVVANLAVDVEGVLDSGLPNAAGMTIFGRYGDSIFMTLLLMCAVLASVARRTGAHHP